MPMFFVHIAKTGGVSVLSVLQRHFAPNEICPHTPSNGVWQGWRFSDMPGFRLYAGHFTYDFFGGQRGTKLMMMRHPIARIASLYDFYRSHRWEYLATVQPSLSGPTIAKSGDFTHFLNTDDPGVIEQSYNPAARQLLGRRYEALMPDEGAVIAQSIRHLEDFSWIGITELFQPSIEALCRTLDWPVPEAVPKENSTYDKSPDDPHVEPVQKTVPNEEQRRLILDRNRIDLALYAEGRKLLEEQVRRLAPIAQ